MHQAAIERDRLLEILDRRDSSLGLYRDPVTRPLVESFFIDLTGSAKISKPIMHYADRHDISFLLAFSVAFVESGFNPRAVNVNSSSVDRGIFQLNSRSFPKLKEHEFFNPETSAKYGLAHLRFCLDEGKNDIVAMAMYNAGKQRVTSRGAPVMTLGYISRYVDYRGELEGRFTTYMRDSLWNRSFASGSDKRQAGLHIDTKGSAK